MTENALFKRRTWMLGVAGLWTGLSAAQPAAQRAFRVGFLRDYLPFSFAPEPGAAQGFDVEVNTHLVALMHGQIEVVTDSFRGLTQRLARGEIDWIGNQLLATPENRRVFDLVRPPYASVQLSVIQHEDDARDFLSLEDLYGRQLGVLVQTGIEEQARGVLGNSVRGYTHIEQALMDLAAQKLDAVLEENLIVDYYIEKHHLPLKVAAPFAAPLAVGLAVRKGDEVRRVELAAHISNMLKDGAIAKISRRWFGYDVSRSRVSHGR